MFKRKISYSRLTSKTARIARKRDKEQNFYKRIYYTLGYMYWVHKWEKYFD